jgi:purine catabolism regulator
LYNQEQMPITVRDLLELPGLGLSVAAGSAGLDRPIRIVHTSELGDPTPWLSGDEFLLTTGMGAGGSPALQRAYIRRLVKARVAGLGFGLGFGFDSVPAPLIKAADREGLPLLEVPYPVPFLAIAEAVASRLAEDRVREAQSSVEVHERLALLVSDGSGPADVLDEVTAIAGGWAALFDGRGQVVAASRSTGERDLAAVWGAIPTGLVEAPEGRTAAALGPDGTLIAVAVVAAKRPEGVLVFGKEGRIHAHDRMVVHHAVTVVGLLLAYRRAIIDTERRVAGDILSEAFEGRLVGEDLERRLVLAGFPAGEPLTALVIECAEHPESLGDLLWSVDAALGSRTSAVRTTITPASVTAVVAGDDPVGLARSLVAPDGALAPFARALGGCRVGVGERSSPADVRRSYLSAQLALKAAPSTSALATQDDLGSFAVLLRSQPRSTLEGYVRAVLGPLIDRDQARNSDLLASVRAFVEAGGRWEPGAEALSVHRHTLRYRIHQAEELLGRDLSSPRDQLEILLALKAAEILGT